MIQRRELDRKPPQPSLSLDGDPFEFRNQTWQAKSYAIAIHFSENCMNLASAVLSQYTRVRDDTQTTNDDGRHLIPIAELTMQLQRSAKSRSVPVSVIDFITLA